MKNLLISMLVLLPAASFSTELPRFQSNKSYLSAHGKYFSTSSNYDESGGAFAALGDDRSYTNFEYNFEFMHALNRRMAVFADMTGAYAASTNTDFDRTNTQINEVGGGLYYKVMAKPFYLVPVFKFEFPIYTVAEDTDDVITGEGVMKASAGAWLAKKFDPLVVYSYLGGQYRADGRSSLFIYEVGGFIDLDGLEIGGAVHGFSSITDDEFTDDPDQRNDIVARVSSGSLYYYGVNPSLLAAKGFVIADFTKSIKGRFEIDKTINGANYANGLGILASVQYSWGESERLVKKRPFNKKTKEDTQSFNIDSEKYDEKIFEDENFDETGRPIESTEDKIEDAERMLEN